MAISKQRIYQKSGSGPKDYTIIHPETSSDIVMRPTGYSVEEALVAVIRRLDEANVGGSGGGIGSADLTLKNDVAALKTAMTSAQTEIGKLQDEIKSLKSRVSALESFSLG